jgi:hypothetical protein
MIDNVNQFLGNVAGTELAKTARRSARVVWNAHCAAFETTRVEARKVISLAIDEGQKLAGRVNARKASVARATVGRRATRRGTRRAA